LDVGDLDLALHLADVADEITQAAFAAKTFTTHVKDDGSPVTDVDVAVEESLVDLLENRRPEDAVLSEELGVRGRARRRWVIDGIDGTAAFARGGSSWGTLIALCVDEEVMVGVATSPGLGRRWWAARGAGAWAAPLSIPPGGAPPERLAVSRPNADDWRWSVVPTPERLIGWRREAGLSLEADTGSAFDPLRVVEGDLDGVVVLYGGPWDHAPFVVLVEEAGGRFSDLWGGRRLDTRTAIYSNGLLHDDLQVRAATAAPDAPESHYDYQ
jgi:histidinol-phosphatase